MTELPPLKVFISNKLVWGFIQNEFRKAYFILRNDVSTECIFRTYILMAWVIGVRFLKNYFGFWWGVMKVVMKPNFAVAGEWCSAVQFQVDFSFRMTVGKDDRPKCRNEYVKGEAFTGLITILRFKKKKVGLVNLFLDRSDHLDPQNTCLGLIRLDEQFLDIYLYQGFNGSNFG